MQTKEQLLQDIRSGLQSGVISQADLQTVSIFAIDEAGSHLASSHKPSFFARLSIENVMYGIGALIIFIGLVTLLAINWDGLSSFVKILSTLGVGIAAYVIAVLLNTDSRVKNVSLAFFILSGIVMPIGLGVTFGLNNLDMGMPVVQIIYMAILTFVYGASFALFKRNTFIVLTTIFATGLYFSLVNWLIDTVTLGGYTTDLVLYSIMVAGVSYILLGYSFTQSAIRAKLTGTLYGFGILMMLGAGLGLGGIWDVLYIGLVFAVILLSVYMKSRAFLIFGAFFLMCYLVKITGQYFADAVSWPIALIFAGFAVIGVGYVAYYINKRYISK